MCSGAGPIVAGLLRWRDRFPAGRATPDSPPRRWMNRNAAAQIGGFLAQVDIIPWRRPEKSVFKAGVSRPAETMLARRTNHAHVGCHPSNVGRALVDQR